jgi:hypothetical protein
MCKKYFFLVLIYIHIKQKILTMKKSKILKYNKTKVILKIDVYKILLLVMIIIVLFAL